jgi:ATP-dependent helicase HrpB
LPASHRAVQCRAALPGLEIGPAPPHKPVMDLPGDPQPIDPLLPRLCAALEAQGQAVLQAPPGAGKTTRVPLALLGRSGGGS